MPKFVSTLINYLKASIEELQKVAWPTRAETVRYSLLVMAVSFGLGLGIGLLDYGFTLGVEKLIAVIS